MSRGTLISISPIPPRTLTLRSSVSVTPVRSSMPLPTVNEYSGRISFSLCGFHVRSPTPPPGSFCHCVSTAAASTRPAPRTRAIVARPVACAPAGRRRSAEAVRPTPITASASAAIRSGLNHSAPARLAAIPPAAARIATPSTIGVHGERPVSGESCSGVAGSGRSQANGAAPSGSQDGGTGGVSPGSVATGDAGPAGIGVAVGDHGARAAAGAGDACASGVKPEIGPPVGCSAAADGAYPAGMCPSVMSRGVQR